MTYRVVQSDHPQPALARDVYDGNEGMSDCRPTQILKFAGIAKTNGSGVNKGVTSIELYELMCEKYEAQVVSFVATVLDRNGEPTPGKPTPIIVWHPIAPPPPNNLRVRVRSVDAKSNLIPDVEFGWVAVVELTQPGLKKS